MQSCIGVLADDLTGSMDAGVQLLNEGYSVKIALSAEAVSALSGGTDIIVLDSESRNAPLELAGRLVEEGVRGLMENGSRLVYKKIDSTLRGNIGGELEAVLTSSRADCVLVAPALPFNQRTTVGGIHYVGGIRLQDTELARDPFSPLYTSEIRQIIRAQTALPAECLRIDTIRDCAASCQTALSSMLSRGVKVIVCDAIDDGDLTCIAKAAERVGENLIFCGSAGFFRYLTDTGRIPVPGAFSRPERPAPANGSILVLSGSPASASKRQLCYAVRQAPERLVRLDVNLPALYEGGRRRETEKERLCSAVADAFRTGCHVLVDAAGESKSKLFYSAGVDRERLNRDSACIQQLLGELAQRAAEQESLRALVLFGGDTAISVAKALGAKGIQILDQVEPYVPMGRFIGSLRDGVPIVTKAGGFGTEGTLVNIIRQLTLR